MKYEIREAGIVKKLPDGYALPASWRAFVDVCAAAQRGDFGWFAIKYTKPADLLGFAEPELVPFLRLPDGGVVLFWFYTQRLLRVVHLDSEGVPRVLAASWKDFLLRLHKRRTGVPDLDDQEARLPKMRGLAANVEPLTTSRRAWAKWCERLHANTSADATDATDAKATKAAESERLRLALIKATAKEMSASVRASEKLLGYSLADDDDVTSMVDLVVHLTSRSYKVTTIGGLPVPRPQRFRKVMTELSEFLGHSLKNCPVSVWSSGQVFVDRNTCLGDPSVYRD